MTKFADRIMKIRTGWARWVARILLGAALTLGCLAPAHAASQPDPCNSLSFKLSAPISVSSATTTSLVSLNANHSIFVCGFTMTIAGSASTAATAALEYGTGAACSSPTTLTGTFGSGDAAASTTPTQVTYGDGTSTVAQVPPANGLCVVTTGTTVDVQGSVTYVQSSGSSYP
jgi:hypothetical protein